MPKFRIKKPKLNKLQRIALHHERQERVLRGNGKFIFRNNAKGTLGLAKPGETLDGQPILSVPVNGEFVGDDYFMYLVKSNEAKLIKTITSPEEEKKQMEEKLILDQPNTVTTEGTTEQVVVQPQQKNAKKKEKVQEQIKQNEVLLTDDPLAGVQILG